MVLSEVSIEIFQQGLLMHDNEEIKNWLGRQFKLEVFVVGENTNILAKLRTLDLWGKTAEKSSGLLILG